MTLQEFQDTLHALYKPNTSTPDSTSDKWAHRLLLLEQSIYLWDAEPGIFWRELWTNLSDASDGDDTINASDLIYGTPTDFRFLGSYVRTTDSSGNNAFYEVKRPDVAERFKNTTTPGVFVTGNKRAGHSINFMTQPTAGHTINYPYYKDPFIPSSAAHVIEMSEPLFAVYTCLAKLHEQAGDGDRANLALQTAQQIMKSMKLRNENLPYDQSNQVQNFRLSRGVGGFGV